MNNDDEKKYVVINTLADVIESAELTVMFALSTGYERISLDMPNHVALELSKVLADAIGRQS